jgi:hypothetical protein
VHGAERPHQHSHRAELDANFPHTEQLMPTHEYKLRLPREVPEATSENVARWLEQISTHGYIGVFAADPGGGPVRVSLSLDAAKVVEFANVRREKVHVALRRLIASNVKIEPLPDREEARSSHDEAKELLPEKILPRKLAYESKDFVGFVRAMDKGLAVAYRRIYKLEELKPAETPEEDRDLAAALAEVCNRRSPAWMLANADLVKLGVTSFRWGIAQTEDLDGRVREKKPNGRKAHISDVVNVSPEAAEAATPTTQAPSSAAAPPSSIGAEEMQHINAPVQQEGEF